MKTFAIEVRARFFAREFAFGALDMFSSVLVISRLRESVG